MSLVFILDASATMALGGVATGSMNEYEQQRVAGIIRYKGCCLTAFDCKKVKNQHFNIKI